MEFLLLLGNSDASTPHMQTIKNPSLLTQSHFTFLRGSADVSSRPERQRCCRDQVQVRRSGPSSNTTNISSSNSRPLWRYHPCPRLAASPPAGGGSVPPLQAAEWRRCASSGAELRVALTAAAACERVRNIPPHWC